MYVRVLQSIKDRRTYLSVEGLTIQACLNMNSYAKGIKIPGKEMKRLKMTPAAFHGEWNYSVSPRNEIP